MPSTSLSDKGFRAFAPEIREMIFEGALAGTWNGKTPALIQALRGSKLYLEAIDVFTKTNTFRLHEGNGWSWDPMPPQSLKHIKALQIDLG